MGFGISNKSSMDFKQIEYFVRVAEMGSFTRAAKVLGVAQPALSRQVRLLEVEFRHNLLLRNGRGVTPTEAGKLLLEHGRGILHQVARAREELGRVSGSLAGRVALGLPPSVAKVLTVPLTREFKRRLPSAAVSISEGLTITMQEWLLSGRLDIALLYSPSPTPELETRPLLDEELFLISPQTTQSKPGKGLLVKLVTLKELSELPLVIPSRPNALRVAVETQLASQGLRPRIALEIDGVNAILDLVADGAGYAILPRYALANAAGASFILRSITPKLKTHLALATAANRASTETQKTMMALLEDMTRKLLHQPRSSG